ncbi:MAG TPA: nucleoside phosphorylase [Acidimicrobiales bacterium]|nr:nucleoside phosphorylase [Acidimicrobiales bacterium]
MPVPNTPDKHAGRPYVTPHRLLAYRAEHGRAVGAPPAAVIVSWQRELVNRVRSARRCREITGPAGGVLALSPKLGVARLPIGAPVAAIMLEELAALGVRTVVGIGTAGAIGTSLAVGDVVICSQALRDEGTSHHYAPDGQWAHPHPDLFDMLRAAIPGARTGPTWTTDAPYRETEEEILAYQAEGVLTVDMEASAMFTVGDFLGVRTASVFCISDVLHGPEWLPHFHSDRVDAALWEVFERIEAMPDLVDWGGGGGD